MNYNTNLQTNNTSLQGILRTVNNLTEGSEGSAPETWAFTMEDGSTKNEVVNVVTVCPITYRLDPGITSSNTNTYIKYGDTYETVLSSGTANSYTYFDAIYIDISNGDGTGFSVGFDPDPETPWLAYLSFSNVDRPLEIYATLAGYGHDEDLE